MNICIIGDGLSSLSLAKNLITKKINVDVYHKNKKDFKPSNRTIGISKDNFNFFRTQICKIKKKYFWNIKSIEIFSEKKINEKILKFKNNKQDLFFMIRNKEIVELLLKELKKNKLFKIKKIQNNSFYKKILITKKYDLVINCDSKNNIVKKYFSRQIKKDYKNFAYTTILKHKKLKNKTATQIFTQYGPIAFLPISQTETSVVYSVNSDSNSFEKLNIINLIKKYNKKYIIKNITRLEKFKLELFNTRQYYYKNILMFGDAIHKIHPLAGQGYNMTVRDIKILSDIIQNKIDLGMQLDKAICSEFEKKSKHINFIFSNGIDFIYEFFNFERKIKYNTLNKVIKFFGNNKTFKNLLSKYADKGIM